MSQSGVLRPPAVPLVASDPYFSIWAPHEKLNHADTEHWTQGDDRLYLTATVDGEEFRLVGRSKGGSKAMEQTSLEVRPTQVIATFAHADLKIKVTFLSELISTDLHALSLPLTYITWSVESTTETKHKVEMLLQTSSVVQPESPDKPVFATTKQIGGYDLVRFAPEKQNPISHSGDWTRITWGEFFVGGPSDEVDSCGPALGEAAPHSRTKFKPIISSLNAQSQHAILFFDDHFGVQYFQQNLKGYWARKGLTAVKAIEASQDRLPEVLKRCDQFDRELMSDFERVGGAKYAQLASLAYRQCIAGSKLVADKKGQPLWFPKENSSNGCLATTDVIYPMSPQAFLFGPSLTKALIMPVLQYGSSERWTFPFAPHDLGTYPKANAQVYGGGETTEDNQMPVEESANMLILVAALAKIEGNAEFARPYFETLKKWANYLKEKGFDPENQVCTDDFLGHFAHNVNLSAKAIMGLRSFSDLCSRLGKQAEAEEFLKISTEFKDRWIKESADKGHSRLTFDQPGTWSQKYNLVWDRLLGFNLFPESVIDAEVAHYRKVANPFGPSLDSRGPGAKLDWSVWVATLSGRRDDFDALMSGVYRYVDTTPNRVGLGDWYDTSTSKLNFFQARPVAGGILIPLLYEDSIWKKWANRGESKAANWAPIPKRPIVTPLVPCAQQGEVDWGYTFSEPAPNWMTEEFEQMGWKGGVAGFGALGTPGALVSTEWNTPDIWLRRRFKLDSVPKDVHLWLHHDDDVQVYLNGKLVLERTGWTTKYEAFSIPNLAKILKKGDNLIAIHCHQNRGGQYIDAGFVTVKQP